MNSPAWYALLLILFIISLATRYELLFFFALLMALASLASKLWMRYCLSGVTYSRKLGNTHINYGEETELIIDVVNAKPLPLAWLQVLDMFPSDVTMVTRLAEEGPLRVLVNLMALSWYERVQRKYRIRGDKRGEFAFGPADVISGDIFGFYWRSKSEPKIDKLIVYPKVVPVGKLGFLPAWPLTEQKTNQRLLEDPLRMATVREYAPGDSFRHIHWRASARLGKLQTKVFDPGATQVLMLFTDVQTTPNPYGMEPDYLELVITATASIALHALASKQGVGLYTNGGIGSSSKVARVAASRHPAQGAALLEILARLDPFRQMPIGTLLYREMATLPFGATVVVITALPGPEVYRALLTIRDMGHPVALLTVGEKPVPPQGNLTIHHLGGRDAWQRLAKIELA
ncbi:MAG: DUF58 domain-containing protein [Chloroflexi bacterium]|nr:DUF58 domain-containing protein [Chloroflexota bacterium]